MATLDVLRDKLNADADGELRSQIEERLAPLRQLTRNTPKIRIPAGDYTGAEILIHLAKHAFAERRDQARAKTIDAFLARVAEMGVNGK